MLSVNAVIPTSDFHGTLAGGEQRRILDLFEDLLIDRWTTDEERFDHLHRSVILITQLMQRTLEVVSPLITTLEIRRVSVERVDLREIRRLEIDERLSTTEGVVDELKLLSRPVAYDSGVETDG